MIRRGWLIGATLAAAVAAVATGTLGPQALNRLPPGFESPVLALELVGTTDGFNRLIEAYDLQRPHTKAAETFRRSTYADFVFIAAYATMWILVLRGRAGAICDAGVVLMAIAAAADIAEDVFILRVIDQHGLTAGPVKYVAYAALAKWGALALAFGALAHRFWPDREVKDGWQLYSAAIGLLYAYAGVLCAIGVVVSRPLIERSVLPVSLALLMQLALFWRGGAGDSRRG